MFFNKPKVDLPSNDGIGETRPDFLFQRPHEREIFMKINPLDYVLVIDDSTSMVRIISGIVAKLGYKHIDTASSGADGLKKARTTAYKLILSDWNMENMSGFELLGHIRKLEGAPTSHDVPFILITAEAKAENVIAAKKSGVSGYIVKPFSSERLQSVIESVS